MIIKKATLIRLVRERDTSNGEPVEEFVARILDDQEKLAADIQKHYEDEEQMTTRHDNEAIESIKRVNILKLRCPHYETTYYADASGNNDSSDTCDLCGLEL